MFMQFTFSKYNNSKKMFLIESTHTHTHNGWRHRVMMIENFLEWWLLSTMYFLCVNIEYWPPSIGSWTIPHKPFWIFSLSMANDRQKLLGIGGNSALEIKPNNKKIDQNRAKSNIVKWNEKKRLDQNEIKMLIIKSFRRMRFDQHH